MSSPKARDVAIVPGRLVADPTDLSAVYPHGGTELGVCRDRVFRPGFRYRDIHAEEWGVVADSVIADQAAWFATALRSWDDDVLSQVFPNTSSGTAGHTLVEVKPGVAGQNQPGTLLSSMSVVLFFSPDAVDEQPAILIYNALPMIEESSAIEFGPGVEASLALMWKAAPDATGRCWASGRREDLSL